MNGCRDVMVPIAHLMPQNVTESGLAGGTADDGQCFMGIVFAALVATSSYA